MASFPVLFTNIHSITKSIMVKKRNSYVYSVQLHSTIQNVNIWSEVFIPGESLWKHVDFIGPRFYDKTFKVHPIKTLHYDNNESQIVVEEKDKKYTYKGFIFVEKGNKIFVYTEKVKVVLIIVFPSTKFKYGFNKLLYIRQYPFEAEQDRKLIVKNFSSISDLSEHSPVKSVSPKTGGGLYIFSSNILGIIADITPKYCKRWHEVLARREQKVQEWFKEVIKLRNDGRMLLHTEYIPKITVLNASIVEKADEKFIRGLIKQLPLPNSKMQFIKNPLYILKSQIPKNKILKGDGTPVAEFKGQEVYLRDDLEDIKTSFGWHKCNRKVIEGSKPVMIRHMANKFTGGMDSHYFAESQTILIGQIELNDQAIGTGFSKVDLTGDRFVFKDHVYIKGKHLKHLEYVAKNIDIQYKRAFSSYYYKKGTPSTNIDGIVIAQDKLDTFLSSYNGCLIHTYNIVVPDYINSVVLKEIESERNTYRGFWRNFFLTLLNKPPSQASKSYRDIKNQLKTNVEDFIINLDKFGSSKDSIES
ncbi:hypothetical protein BEWA_030770 [Theileria equi strain WA]|uniref:Uncharacterized protein n=1 Tax=Theileria equi strain WA TaxID=1537102 RepID=L0AZ89_THEEQ|nr:hypothetical protein BEWA_030770 [Theileria equi strain WA]AFZ80224.1 hypothetical protein BEWA_030770 [Theileria equi strain WA]|eukprot:XP_004829890.1 hypothetical protein BEWA_030770 [Theileria equi strain WA]